MTTNSQDKNDALWQAFKPLFDEIEKPRDDLQLAEEQFRRGLEEALAPLMEPILFEFHSQNLAEDGTAQIILFEGSDGHTYCLSVTTAKGWPSAHLLRVD